MGSTNKFSVLLISPNRDALGSLIRLVKRHFHNFYHAHTPEKAVEIINNKGVDVVMFGFERVQESEVCFLHMIRNDRIIEDKIAYTILLCGKEDVQNAFNICNKDIFHDYFIVKPLYDPHHLLLRLRMIRRLNAEHSLKRAKTLSIEELCAYFDQVASSGENLKDLNNETFNKLLTTVSFSMEAIKQQIRDAHANNQPVCHESVSNIIDDHARTKLMPQLEEEKEAASKSIDELVSDLVAASESHKSSVEHEASQNEPQAVSIMLIEDEEQDLQAMVSILNDAGFAPHAATRATTALKNLEQWQPRIAIIDLTLPDMSALHVISRIQNHPKLSNTKIMALAKKGDKDKVMEAVKMGISEVMVKPVDKELLMYKINYNLNA